MPVPFTRRRTPHPRKPVMLMWSCMPQTHLNCLQNLITVIPSTSEESLISFFAAEFQRFLTSFGMTLVCILQEPYLCPHLRLARYGAGASATKAGLPGAKVMNPSACASAEARPHLPPGLVRRCAFTHGPSMCAVSRVDTPDGQLPVVRAGKSAGPVWYKCLTGAKKSETAEAMNGKRTVLVLGAGASYPYGFPLGEDLKKDLLLALRSDHVSADQVKSLGCGDALIEKFKESLERSSHRTIDELLETKPKFRQIGAFLIASVIAGHEHLSLQKMSGLMDMDWYGHLYRILNFHSGVSDDIDLTVVSLNYDRSLEFFLDDRIGLDCPEHLEEQARRKLKRIRFIHPHGCLGDYHSIPYRLDLHDLSLLQKAADNIRIVADRIDDEPAMKDAQDAILAAQDVLFIGFRYDPRTLDRLFRKFLSVHFLMSGRRFIGTGFDFHEFANVAGRDIRLANPDVDAAKFIQHYQDEQSEIWPQATFQTKTMTRSGGSG